MSIWHSGLSLSHIVLDNYILHEHKLVKYASEY